MTKNTIKFGKTVGNGRQDGYTETDIILNGKRVGFITARFHNVDPCDWYSSRSSRCVAVEAEIWLDDETITLEIPVYNCKGGSWIKREDITSRTARSQMKRMVRAHLAG